MSLKIRLNIILEKILEYYFVWGLVIALTLKVIDIQRPYYCLAIMALAYIAMSFFTHKNLRIREFAIRYWPVTLIAVANLIYQVLFLEFEPIYRTLLRGFVIYLLIYTGFLYEKRCRDSIGKIFKITAYMLGVASIIGIIWWAKGIYPIEKISVESAKYFYSAPQRMDSVFLHPIIAGCFMLFLVSIILFAWSGNKISNIARFLLLLLGIAGIYTTLTRSAYLILAAMPIIWAIGRWNLYKKSQDNKRKRKINNGRGKPSIYTIIAVAICAIALLSVIFYVTGVVDTIYDRFFGINWREDPSYTFRMDSLKITIDSIFGRGFGRFLFGMGAGKGNNVLKDAKWFTEKYEVIHGIDNSYSTMFLEQGIFACILYIYEIIYVFKQCVLPEYTPKSKSTKKQKKIASYQENSIYFLLLPQLLMAITFDAQNWPGTEFVIFILIGMEMAQRRYPHPGFSKKHPLIINGRIFAQNVTGVQRYGIEIIKQLDKMVEPGEVILALPEGELQTQPGLTNIKTEVIGKGNGNKWTQLYLPIYAYKKHGTILSFAGIPPVLKPDYATTHDISFLRYPQSYGKSFRLVYRIGYLLTVYRCKRIITISQFARDEFITFYDIEENRFIIAGNSAEHLVNENIKIEQKENNNAEQILSKWNLTPKIPYYLSVGSKNLHKNQKYIKKLAKKYPDKIFVIAGGSSARSFGNSGNMADTEETNTKDTNTKEKHNENSLPNNLILTGYITDEELLTLYTHAYCFIFPSLYEGFGIPPMEAIFAGVPHIALSDIPVMREIYKKGCYFFDPTDVNSFNMDKMLKATKQKNKKLKLFYSKKYSWKNSAETIIKAIR